MIDFVILMSNYNTLVLGGFVRSLYSSFNQFSPVQFSYCIIFATEFPKRDALSRKIQTEVRMV